MATFSYVGIDTTGKEKKGSIDAEDRDRAVAAVKQLGLIPTEVTEQNFLNKDIDISFSKKASARDLSLFCRQFSSLLRAGVTVVDALNMLSESTENKGFSAAIKGCAITIQKGETLGVAMRDYTQYFDTTMISLVDAGEASGSLDVSMERMAIQYEKSAHIKGLVKKAMIYPIIVIIVAIAVVVVMLLWVVPSFMEMFEEIDMDMPKMTQLVINLSDFLKSNYITVAIVAVVVFVVCKLLGKTQAVKIFMARLGLRIKFIANFTVKNSCAKMARTLSTLTGSGLSLTEAIEITSHTMTNVLFKDALINAKTEVMQGVPLSEPLQRSGIFPAMIINMIKIGEETGELDDMLEKSANYYEEEVELATQSLLAAIEPMIILLLAGIVVFILLAVFSPMVALYQGLDTGL